MKRSEMLSIIESVLEVPFSEGGDYYSKKILAAIEEAGMLPPVRSTLGGEVTMDLYEAILDQLDSDCKWEDE